jgi:hypothetical protein
MNIAEVTPRQEVDLSIVAQGARVVPSGLVLCLRHTQPSHVFDVTVSGYGGGEPCYEVLDESVMLVPYKENVCPNHHTILFSCLVFVQQTINVVRQLILIGHSSFVYLG